MKQEIVRRVESPFTLADQIETLLSTAQQQVGATCQTMFFSF